MASQAGEEVTPAHVAFGHEVRRRRIEQGLSIDALGARAGLGGNFISKVENAQVDLCLSSAFKLATGLGCKVGDLMPPVVGGLSAAAREAGRRFNALPPGDIKKWVLRLIRVLCEGRDR